MIYLDSNLFLYAILYPDVKGEKARNFLKSVREGPKKACTASLTYDEIIWKVKVLRGPEDALLAGEAFLNMGNLEIVEIGREILWMAHSLMKEVSLDPRDAIHAACCLKKGAEVLVSEDSDFDKIKGMKRKWIF